MGVLINLRDFARGKDCQLRQPGVCNFDPETTGLAHVRRGGVAGVGQKPPDLCGIHSCSRCHDALDGRAGPQYEVSDADVLEALNRTLAVVWEKMNE